jgi:SAM-dependent methyltransferase
MLQFYALAGEDYRQLALARDWAAWLAERVPHAGAPRLLDVACGSGKFPAALVRHADLRGAGLEPIRYDLLDPTSFALNEARGVLEPPFVPGRGFECRLQDFETPDKGYHVVWATHALYAVPAGELREALTRFVEALAPDGRGFIAHARHDSHYLDFYRVYLGACGDGAPTPYSSAEQIEATLRDLGIGCETQELDYTCRASAEAEAEVEGYLQRCLFDDTIGLDDMKEDPALGAYLRGCRDAEGWCFRQRVAMLSFSP